MQVLEGIPLQDDLVGAERSDPLVKFCLAQRIGH